jgi:hypothetical protein
MVKYIGPLMRKEILGLLRFQEIYFQLQMNIMEWWN